MIRRMVEVITIGSIFLYEVVLSALEREELLISGAERFIEVFIERL